MEKVYVKGDYLEIETTDGNTFTGWFHSQKKDKSSICLFNVKEFPKGDVMKGKFIYYKSEIRKIQRIVDPSHETLVPKLNAIDITNDELDNLSIVSKKFIFINQTDRDFEEAINDLKCYSHIAVGTEGSEMGRNCKLPLLTLSTPSQIYIFDIQVMPSAFGKGLKEILESDSIKKIIHNCKKLSDCLYHKHEIKLKNVYDTQVADVIIYKNKNGCFPDKYKTLRECLECYLGFNEEVSEKIDIVEWSKRPLTIDIKEIAAQNILYLHKLSEKLHEEMMAPLARGVEYFVSHLRQSSNSEAWQMGNQDRQISNDFKEAVGSMSKIDNEASNKE